MANTAGTPSESTLKRSLEDVTALPRAAVLDREKSTFDEIAGGEKGIVIFGCGYLGHLAFSGAVNAGLEPLAFADNNRHLWGTTLSGVPVLSPGDAIRLYPHAVFVVGVYNGTPVRRQLTDLGCQRVVPYPMLFWRYSQFMPQETRHELPHRVLEQLEDLERGYMALHDERSRREFAAQIRWRCSLDYDRLPEPDPALDMYFPPELITLSQREVMVDCGAFDGDSIRVFLDRTGERFDAIYAFEPDVANYASLTRFITSLPAEARARIAAFPYATGETNGTVYFNAEASVASKILESEEGVPVECRRLDDVLANTKPTFIKMDIEGAEIEALRGGRGIIAKNRPTLAICAYHRCDHMWRIPVVIRELWPDYRIYLRRYAEEFWESVYYAIPPQ